MTLRIVLFNSVAFTMLFSSAAHAEIVPNSTYRLVPATVYEARPVTAYRVQEETIVEQKPVTTYKTETVTEMREKKYRVAKPVVETSEKVERYTVRRPVTETSWREEAMDKTTYETETRWREERRTVAKPVVETSEREERRTVLRPVTEYDYKDEEYTVYRPVTTTETQWQDRSGYVDVPQYVPGAERTRLRWLPRTVYQNPQTGLATTQRAGFYWVPQQGQGTWTAQRQFVPNYVPAPVAKTSMVPETVTRRVPVERTRYEEEVQVRKVPVETYRTVEEEQVRYVPETVKKPVVQRYTRKVPVTRTRWEEEERERRVPVTTRRIEYEDKVEQVPVEVQRTVPVRELLEREKTVRRLVPYTKEEVIAKRVMMKEPIADDWQFVPNSYETPYSVSRPSVTSQFDDTSVTTSAWRVVTEELPTTKPESKIEPADVPPSLKRVEAETDSFGDDDNKVRGTKPLHFDE